MALKKLLPAPPYSAGIFHTHDAEVEQLADQPRVEVRGFVHFAHLGQHAVVREGEDRVEEESLLVPKIRECCHRRLKCPVAVTAATGTLPPVWQVAASVRHFGSPRPVNRTALATS